MKWYIITPCTTGSFSWELQRSRPTELPAAKTLMRRWDRHAELRAARFLPDSIHVKSLAHQSPSFGAFFTMSLLSRSLKVLIPSHHPPPTQILTTGERKIPLAGNDALDEQQGFPLHPLRLGSASLLRNYNCVRSHLPKECWERAFIYS